MRNKKADKPDYVAEEHGPVYNFFYSYKTHFYQLMTSNLMLVVFNIPMLFVAYLFSLEFLPWINHKLELNNFVEYWGDTLGASGNASLGNDISGRDAAYQLYYMLMVFCVMFLIATSLICIGPFQAGFHQIYRNLHRQSGVFIWSDFKDGVKNNLKQSLIVMLIGILGSAVILFAIGFYLNGLKGGAGTALATFFGVSFFVFMFIQNMVYQIMVSVELPLGKIYRNALLFFLLKPGPSIMTILASVTLLGIIPFAMMFTSNYALMGITVFYYLVFVITFNQYMIAFETGEYIDQFVAVQNPPQEDEEEFKYYSEDREGPSEIGKTDKEEEDNDESDNEATNEEFHIIEEANQSEDNG